MRSLIFISIFCLTFLFSHCKKPIAFYEFNEFPETLELTHTPIYLSVPVLYPSGFVFLDTLLVILDSEGDYFLSIYSTNNYTLKSQNIREGRGPQEEMGIYSLSKAIEDNQIWYKTVEGITVSEFCTSEMEFSTVMLHPNCDDFSGKVDLIGNKLIGLSFGLQNREFVSINPNNCIIDDFGADYPNVGVNLTEEEKSHIFWNKNLATKPDGTIFAAAYMDFPIIRVFSTDDGNLMAEARFENKQKFPYATLDRNATRKERVSTIANYYLCYTTDRFIYASYLGKSMIEVQPNIINEDLIVSDVTNEIHIFDWNGNPVRRIILDKGFFFYGISPDDKTLVAISMSEPDVLLKYDLNGN